MPSETQKSKKNPLPSATSNRKKKTATSTSKSAKDPLKSIKLKQISKKDEEIIKKRLKKMIEKEASSSSSTKKASSSKAPTKKTANSSMASCCSATNWTTASSDKKFVLKSSPACPLEARVFNKKATNTPPTKSAKTTNKKTTTKIKSTKTIATSTKPTTKAKPSTGGCGCSAKPKSKSSTTKSKAGCCASESCCCNPKTVTKKTATTKVAEKRKQPKTKSTAVPIKKSKSISGYSKLQAASKSGTSKKALSKCFQDTSSEDDEDDDGDGIEYGSYTDFSDTDTDSCGGCQPPKKNRNVKSSKFYNSESWESDSGDQCCGPRGYNGGRKHSADINKATENEDKAHNIISSLIPFDHIVSPQQSDYDSVDEFFSFENNFDSFSEFESFDECSLDDDTIESNDYTESQLTDDSSDDIDYQLPDSEAEDVVIRKGNAKSYPIDDQADLDFDSDASSLQVIELTNKVEKKSNKALRLTSDDLNMDSDNSCPQLVPIEQCIEEYSEYLDAYSEGDLSSSGNDLDRTKMKAHVIKAKNINKKQNICLWLNNDSDMKETAEIDSTGLREIINTHKNVDSSKYKVIRAEGFSLKIYGKKNKTNKSMKLQTENNLEEANVSKRQKLNPNEESSQLEETEKSSSETSVELENTEQKFESRFYNAINSRQVLLLLKDTLYMYGTLKVKLIAGGAEVFGFKLPEKETHEIFSPRGYSTLYINPIQSTSIDLITLQTKLATFENDFLKIDLAEICEHFENGYDAVVLFERNDFNRNVDMVKKYIKQNLFPNMRSILLERPFYTSEFMLKCILNFQNTNALYIDPKWSTINVKNFSKLMIIGGKNIGKSTLVRYLINRHLWKFKEFLLIDLDIGQPEVFVPQTISATVISRPLLGPGYFQGLQPQKAYLFGNINIVISPLSYIKNVKELLEWCDKQTKYKDIPWIVNTMGYNKGFGSELIAVIAQLLHPSDIIQLQSSREINNFDFIMSPENMKNIPRNVFSQKCLSTEYQPKHNLFLSNSCASRNSGSSEWDMTAKDMRYAILVSRLGNILTGHSEWLTDVKPFSVSVEKINIINFSDEEINSDELLDIVNGNLVYLCQNSNNNTVECYGIGIVRGVNKFRNIIYLLAAIDLDKLRNVDTLAICNIALPTSIMLNQGPRVKDTAPYTYSTNDFVASKHINQIYYRPQHFLHGSHRAV